jgi:hypothetical protein
VHRDLESVTRLAEDVLLGHAHVVERQVPQVVAAKPHRVVTERGVETVHALLEDQPDVAAAVLLVDLGEGDDDVLAAVADPALLAVEHPRAVCLLAGPAFEMEGIGAGPRLGECEPG